MNALTTSGNRIVDSVTGAPILLRGVNRSGLEYSRDPIPEADFENIINGWHANIVRIPFNQEWILADPTNLDLAIDHASRRGAYVLLDLQWLDNRTPRGYTNPNEPNYVPALPNTGSVELWRMLAARYKDNPAVLFDIFNEPHDPLPGDDPALPAKVTIDEWSPWALSLVDAIRSEHPAALIFVPGLDWAYDLSDMPIEGLEGVVYSTHVYEVKGPRWNHYFGALSRNFPVFAGEWGGDDVGWGRRLATYLENHGIGWTAWSWSNKPFLMQNGVPTPFGELVRDLLSQPPVLPG